MGLVCIRVGNLGEYLIQSRHLRYLLFRGCPVLLIQVEAEFQPWCIEEAWRSGVKPTFRLPRLKDNNGSVEHESCHTFRLPPLPGSDPWALTGALTPSDTRLGLPGMGDLLR